jgi:hypothetical protein
MRGLTVTRRAAFILHTQSREKTDRIFSQGTSKPGNMGTLQNNRGTISRTYVVCLVVLLYCRTVVLLYCRTVVLLYCCTKPQSSWLWEYHECECTRTPSHQGASVPPSALTFVILSQPWRLSVYLSSTHIRDTFTHTTYYILHTTYYLLHTTYYILQTKHGNMGNLQKKHWQKMQRTYVVKAALGRGREGM